MTDTPTKPQDRIKVTVNDQDRELLMSAALIRKIINLISDIEAVPMIFIDPVIQEKAIIETLVERDGRGNPVEDVSTLNLFAFNMSTDEGEKLVKWIGDHALYFFTKGAVTSAEALKISQKTVENLMPSLDGTRGLPPMKPSAGATE